MPEKQWPCPGTRNGVLRDPSDTVKAILPESQSPEDATSRPPERYLKPAPCPASESALIRCNLRGVERFPMREFKGMNGAPKSLCYVWQGRTWDRLTGACHVPQGDTGPVVVAGVTTCQGGRESRPQGQAAPSHSALDRSRRERRFGRRRPLGHPPDLDAKARGDSSMAGKRGTQRRR